MSNLPEIITVDQLREEIGDPTTSTQFASHISDDILGGIIDRHIEALESQAYQRINEGNVKPVKQTDSVEHDVSSNSKIPGVAVGSLRNGYFPYATEGVITAPSKYEGQSLDYDPDLLRTNKKSFYDTYLFDIEDRDILVTPSDVQKVTLFLPPRMLAIREIMADIINEVNANIIQRAQQALEAREREFGEPAYAGGGQPVEEQS